MVEEDINDLEAPTEIKAFVRDNEHILFKGFIDRGYNGIVYFGTRVKMGEEVVVKFYLANEEFDESEEALILRRISHENILRVDDIKFLPPSNTYFLSPLIAGGDLQNLIDTETISSATALRLVQKLLLGLNELHSIYKLVHRDLKPANLLYDSEKDNPIIADLGSVKKLDECQSYTTASRCTTLYLPPESIEHNRYSIKSDIYQMGITLYQLLGGFFPLESPLDFLNSKELKILDAVPNGFLWTRKSNELINEKILKGKILNLKTLPAHLPARFKNIVRKACHIDENKRYNNVSLFLTDVNRLIQDFPDYIVDGDEILIKHANLNEYRITSSDKKTYQVSKKLNGKGWRRVKTMDGSLPETIKSTLKP